VHIVLSEIGDIRLQRLAVLRKSPQKQKFYNIEVPWHMKFAIQGLAPVLASLPEDLVKAAAAAL
jgi:hypothetical protein